MENATERMRILDLIESGQITAEQGLRQLAALTDLDEPVSGESASQEENLSAVARQAVETQSPDSPIGPDWNNTAPANGSAGETPAAEPVQPEIVSEAQREDFERWKRYWMIPLWIGVGITIFGGLLMYWALESAGIGFWFLCATVPFIIGVLVMVLGAQSRTAHWLHLRVQQPPGERPQRIAISFPIPIGLAAWFFRTFRYRIPGMDNVPVNIDEILTSVRDSTSPENPIYIRVDEDDDKAGEKVEIYIG